jgi:pimeloyl-ACP methyl ester carboxylesterase
MLDCDWSSDVCSSDLRATRAYRLEHLVEDLGAVIDTVSPDRPVHLVGHDWGSIQSWEAVTTRVLAGRIASYTSISGPSLDHAGHWISRRLRRDAGMGQVLRQLGHSWYVGLFHLPVLAPTAWKFGLGRAWPAILGKLEGTARPAASTSQSHDGQTGVKLYRANFAPRLLNPQPRHCEIPVQLIVPTRDPFMVGEIWDDLPRWAPKLWRRDIDAGHWLPLSHPKALADWLVEFVTFVDSGRESLALRRARVGAQDKLEALVSREPASHTVGSLVPRKVAFDWSQTPLEWIPGQPFASHFINQINLILPAGEFWFCKLYNKALPQVRDAKLREDVQNFVRQEAMHARGHGAAITGYLQARGVDTTRNTQIMDWLFDVPLADAPFGRKLPKAFEQEWLVFRLGIIAAVEHMTCVLGKYVLENQSWDQVEIGRAYV